MTLEPGRSADDAPAAGPLGDLHVATPDSVLLCAAAEPDLSALRALLADLPDDQYGHVLVETAAGAAYALRVPPRMSLTWIRRPLAEPLGDRAAHAVAGWAAEWMHDTGHDATMPRLVWLGRSVRVAVGGALPRCGCAGHRSCTDADRHRGQDEEQA